MDFSEPSPKQILLFNLSFQPDQPLPAMYKPSLFFLLSAAAVIYAERSPQLLRRQSSSCSDLGKKECGAGCIDMTYTCCPDQSGGCPLGEYCDLMDNNQYGCCPTGESCKGFVGVITRGTVTFDRTVPVPEPTTLQSSGCSSQGLKQCGLVCTLPTYTCCPDKAGGCAPGTHCSLGTDGKYGCCEDGEVCTGPGGPPASSDGTIISSSHIAPISSRGTIRSADATSIPGQMPTRTQATTSTSSLTPTPTNSSGATVSNAQAWMPIELFVLALLFFVR